MTAERMESGAAVLRLDLSEAEREDFTRWAASDALAKLRADPNIGAVRCGLAVDAPFSAWVHLDLHDLDLYRREHRGATLSGISCPAAPAGEAFYRQIFPQYGKVGRNGWDFSKWRYEPPGGTNLLLAMAYDVPEARDEEFNAWYEDEHVPMFLDTPGIVTARRFRREDGTEGEPDYLALYDLLSIYQFYSDAFFKVRYTPWTNRIHSLVTRRFRAMFRTIQ